MDLFYRDADDTKQWISEKDTALSSSDYGRDLASVQALKRKHDVMERDLAALEEKVSVRLCHWVLCAVVRCSAVKFFIVDK